MVMVSAENLISLEYSQRIYFRDLFREGRTKALENAENFSDIIFALERLGNVLSGKPTNLGKYESHICRLAENSVLTSEIPAKLPEFHTDFRSLYELVRNGRNSVMHEGAFARNLTSHAIEISVVLEDALMGQEKTVKDFMVRNPVCAFEWQPISFIRQTMLTNSFSYLPVFHKEKWKLISDWAIIRYLQEGSPNREKRLERLGCNLIASEIPLIETETKHATDKINQFTDDWNGLPLCITLNNSSKELVGILTPFDLL
jgi:CBS domain-containing protein